MQKQYLSLGNENVFNGSYMLTVFHMEPYGEMTLEDAATDVAAESSTGTSVSVKTSTIFSETLNALIYKIDKEKNLVYIAYPWMLFDSGGNVQNILTYIAGNIFGSGFLKSCKLLDVQFPSAMLVHYDGPSTTIYDLRNYLKNYHKPIIGSIVKPKAGLTSTEYAEVCYDFWVGGGDFVKNDEPQADAFYAPYNKMVQSVKAAMDKAEDVTGQTKVHSFNVSAADFDTMLKRADYVRKVMNPGSYAFLVDGLTCGWTAVQTIRRHHPDVFLHFHRAGHGAYTRKENPFGYSVLVLTKFAKLAGASGIHTGTAGIGKMDGNKDEDITSAKQALRLKSSGHYFDQYWGEIPEKDADMQLILQTEEKIWNLGARELSKYRKGQDKAMHPALLDGQWRSIMASSAIISGGLNPLLLSDFIDTIGTIDFITTMGGGVHGHPGGTQGGARAFVQAFEAWYNNIPIAEYAKENKELQQALEYYSEHKTQGEK